MVVAGGLLAGLALGGIKLFDNQSKAQKTVEANHEVTTIIHEMRTILGKQINCTASFAGIDVDTGVTTRIKKETSPAVFDELFIQDIIQPNNISV